MVHLKDIFNELVEDNTCINCGNIVDENLRKWFKDKWVRVGPKGKIRGACGGKSKGEGKPKCLPKANFHIIQDSGHSMPDPGIAECLVKYTDKFSSL